MLSNIIVSSTGIRNLGNLDRKFYMRYYVLGVTRYFRHPKSPATYTSVTLWRTPPLPLRYVTFENSLPRKNLMS